MIRHISLALLAFMLTSCEDSVVEKIAQTYKDGTPKVVNIFNNEETLKIGYRAYHENGNISMEGDFLNDKKHGQWRSYFSNGSLWTVNNYDQGEFHGEYLMYNQNGTIRISGHYTQNIQSGKWTVTEPDGAVIREDDFGAPQ